MSAHYPKRFVDALACFATGGNPLGRRLAMALVMAVMAPAAWGGLSAVSASFSPSTIVVGSTATLTITIQNKPPPGNPSDISFTDLYPANLVNVPTPNVVNTCGGTAVAVAGGTSLSLSGGDIGGNNFCTISVTVTSTVAGSYLNSTGMVTSSNAGSIGPATATLTVTAAPPLVTKTFSPASITVGGLSTLAITLSNSNPTDITGVALTDTYPSSANKNASPALLSNSCGGTATAAAGESSLSLSGGTIPANGSCTVSVRVTSTEPGNYLNSTGPVTSGNAGAGSEATAMLNVASNTSGNFNAFETGTAAGSITGVIRTKVAASAFGLDVVALDTAGTAVETAFAGDVRLELVDASGAASCIAYAPIRNLGTLTFAAADKGRKSITGISEPEAWPSARIRMSFPATGTPTVVACSNDNFAIRPASFGSVAASDLDSMTAGNARALDNTAAGGGSVHRAGRPFSIVATARNTTGGVTANYAGSPAASVTACLLPGAGCTAGALTAGSWSAASGTVTTNGASYSEVGAFSMKLVDTSFALVDATDGSSAAEMAIESAAFNVGRFVPDHFELTAASVPQFKTFNDTSCPTRSFTYVGQPFGYLTLPLVTIAAKNAAGATTLNYAGALWKLAPAGATQTYAAVGGTLDIGLVGAPALSEAGNGTGTLTADADDVVAFVRGTPVAPFMAAVSLTMRIQDTSENAVTGNGVIDTATPALFSDIVFDAGNEIRFGRLALANAHGSELLGLPVPIETQFWNGSGFARNAADFCTQLAASQVALTGWRRDLNACETSVSLSGRFDAGRGKLRFSAPGAGNTGSVDLALQLGATGSGSGCVAGVSTAVAGASQSWLQGQWSGGAYDQNPAARASFGLYRGSKALIYLREMH